MKNTIQGYILLLFSIVGLMSCKKEVELDLDIAEHQAIISGYMLADDVCESGYIINLITDPPTVMPMYSLQLPADSDINRYSLFPINVAIQFENDTSACYNNYIKITKLRIVK